MRVRLLSAASLAALTAGCMQTTQAPPPPPPQAVSGTIVAPPPPPPPGQTISDHNAPTKPMASAVMVAPPPPPPPPPPGGAPKFTPPSTNPATVPSGTYAVEPGHTMVMFSVLHFGISTYYGNFANASGTLTVDAKNPAADALDVSVPTDTVYTTSARLTEELKSKAWLDAADYPAMTFKSTQVIPTGHGTAKVIGDLTLHGVTKPVTLTARFMAAGINPMMGKMNVGFTVSGDIERSDFGVSAAVPMVSDDTKLIISAAFTAQ